MQTIWKFVLTGGPGGGKTTGIPILKQFLEEKGFKVFIVPEAATIVNSQMELKSKDIPLYHFQVALIETELYLENIAFKFASQIEQDVILLLDRAILDTKAYMSDKNFTKILNEKGLTETEVLNRYDAIFHMVTAANGAEEFYCPSGIRTETPEAARELDDKILKVWQVHPNLYVLDNSTNFNEKINRLILKINEIIESK